MDRFTPSRQQLLHLLSVARGDSHPDLVTHNVSILGLLTVRQYKAILRLRANGLPHRRLYRPLYV